MADAPAAVYLYTGRKTAAAAPAEPAFAPSVFQVPGRYLATRILADSLTVIVLGSRGVGSRRTSGRRRLLPRKVLQRQDGAAAVCRRSTAWSVTKSACGRGCWRRLGVMIAVSRSALCESAPILSRCAPTQPAAISAQPLACNRLQATSCRKSSPMRWLRATPERRRSRRRTPCCARSTSVAGVALPLAIYLAAALKFKVAPRLDSS